VAAVPIKPEYKPTLGQLLAPRWHSASPLARGAVIVSLAALLAVIVATVLTLENPSFTHGGRVPFSFSYRGLYRVRPDPGGWVKVQRRNPSGRLEDSFAVEPLTLPPYGGAASGELPLYAEGYIVGLRRRYRDFVLRGDGVLQGDGNTQVNSVSAYNVVYTANVEGRRMFGRDVLLLPQRPGAREGVDIVMLTAPDANPQVTSPLETASAGVLLRPLKTFTLG
jgi:hypothetical protein